ncbi:glutamyl-tRNA reductase [Agromyces sp. SYSU T00194]|uniref:glutamyl-tRNA reductase n=1 Tax=Agromyces chitinivorans TaxID=3158560 RepID=UPI00339B8A62
MLICLSASHKNADFDLLEKLSVAPGDLGARIVGSHESFSGSVIVATCNRFEAYLDLDEPYGASPVPAIQAALRAVGGATDVDARELRSTVELVHGNAVAEHLFAVASGLESVVVGEGEIAGQVKRSLEEARQGGTTTPEIERLFQRASRVSRTVKNQTGVGSAGRSLVRLALDLAESRITDWAATRILLVGTGQYAGASLAAVRDRGAADVRVFSPSGRATRFARNHGIAAVARADLAAEAAAADVVITCTTVDHHVIDAALLAAGRADAPEPAPTRAHLAAVPADDAHAPSARQLLIDLGLPRNIDPDVVSVDGVELLDLETIRIHAPIEELTATDAARTLVSRAAREFSAHGEELDLAPAVVALRSHVFDVLDDEIERARARGDEDGRTEQALRHMAGVLLHTPMVRSRAYARAGDQRAWIEGLEALFGIVPEAAAAPAADAGSAATDADTATA